MIRTVSTGQDTAGAPPPYSVHLTQCQEMSQRGYRIQDHHGMGRSGTGQDGTGQDGTGWDSDNWKEQQCSQLINRVFYCVVLTEVRAGASGHTSSSLRRLSVGGRREG